MRFLPFLMIALCLGCAQPDGGLQDHSTHVERVLEDVSAMMEGMAGAHTADRVVLRGPEYRSSAPHGPQ